MQGLNAYQQNWYLNMRSHLTPVPRSEVKLVTHAVIRESRLFSSRSRGITDICSCAQFRSSAAHSSALSHRLMALDRLIGLPVKGGRGRSDLLSILASLSSVSPGWDLGGPRSLHSADLIYSPSFLFVELLLSKDIETRL